MQRRSRRTQRHAAHRQLRRRFLSTGQPRRYRMGRLSGAIADTLEGRAINALAVHPVEYRTNDTSGQRGNWGP